ncbi:MAG: 23S rRNA (uracil(1939)-C(5))-methyltransferase RlmD, partial [Oscillospiraceae bacterium]
MITKNDEVQIEITAMSTDGNGVGHIEGFAVFVPYTAVGDILLIKIVKVLKNYAFGIIQQILTPAKGRIENDCDVYTKCGGCSFRHVDYQSELEYKGKFVEDNFRKIGGITVPVSNTMPSPQQSGYRNKAQYPVAKIDGKVIIGFFAKRSHRAYECMNCPLQPEFFSGILKIIKDFIEEKNVSVYDETTHKGLIRHIYIRYAHRTQQVMICIVANGNGLQYNDLLISRLTQVYPQIKTVILNINKQKNNVILGEQNIVLYGDGIITDIMCGLEVELSPLSFYQVNTAAAESLYRMAEKLADFQGNEVLIDLYCGTGTIGLSMAGKVKQLIGVEIVPDAIKNAEQNAVKAGISNAQFLCDDAGGAAISLSEQGIKPDVVIVDPPRKGCSDDVIEAIAKMAPQKVIMISCNSATAARDCKALCEKGYK